MPITLFLLQLAATLCMTGLIWFVQIVHYPLFAGVGESGFPAYSRQHARRTGWVVAPFMLAELGAALLSLLGAFRPAFLPEKAALAFLLVVIWCSTALLQIPLHNRLAHGFHAPAARKLVTGNWLRTVCWTLRAFLLLWCLRSAILTKGMFESV